MHSIENLSVCTCFFSCLSLSVFKSCLLVKHWNPHFPLCDNKNVFYSVSNVKNRVVLGPKRRYNLEAWRAKNPWLFKWGSAARCPKLKLRLLLEHGGLGTETNTHVSHHHQTTGEGLVRGTGRPHRRGAGATHHDPDQDLPKSAAELIRHRCAATAGSREPAPSAGKTRGTPPEPKRTGKPDPHVHSCVSVAA